jgi:hypothetical protein
MQKQCALAERLTTQALNTAERALGESHPDVFRMRVSLIGSWLCSRQVAKAERLLGPTLRSMEASLGPRHPDLIPPLAHAAQIDKEKFRYQEAAAALDRAIRISLESGAENDPRMIPIRREYFRLLRKLRRGPEAKRIERTLKSTLAAKQPEPRDER